MTARPWQKFYDYYVPQTIRYPRHPVQRIFSTTAGTFPNKVCTNFYGSELTYWQVREQVLRLANALAAKGVKKGDRVGIQLPNCPQFIVAYLAVMHLGGIVVNINPLYTAAELTFIIENTTLNTLITFDMFLDNVRQAAKETGLKGVIVTKITDYINGLGVSTAKSLNLEEGWLHFTELIENCKDTRPPRVPIVSSDPAMIQFTGGTTGFPKGALLTHGNLVAATFQAGLWASPGAYSPHAMPQSERSALCVLPFFHVYGNIVAMNWAFFGCATQIILPRFEIDEIIDTIIKAGHITYFPAVPTMITALVNHPKASGLDLGRYIGLLNSGGAPMPVELIERVIDLGITFNEGYGLSETSSITIANPIAYNKVGSIGIPMADNDFRIVDVENGVEDVKPGSSGELLVKGPTVMQGYWNNPTETANQLKDGWLYTGDIAQVDEDGYIFIVDRKKDMIIASGFNIYPREIEEVLYEHPKISEAVAIGIPHDYRGETVKAFVVLQAGETASEEEIIEFCKKKLTAYKVPKIVEFRQAVPKSPVGKILRKVLRDEELAKLKK
ncbi:MAG TPA: long-chain fatty acid--CoA ligase [Smithellaceae bacterium]|nr:long-chain fatty acid--CoA ligase [Smithellaceae bacterium]